MKKFQLTALFWLTFLIALIAMLYSVVNQETPFFITFLFLCIILGIFRKEIIDTTWKSIK